MNRLIWSFGFAAVVTVVAACGAGASTHHEGSLKADGVVTVGDRLVSTSAVQLRSGDEVKVTEGSAVVKLPDGGQLELRSGSSVRFNGGPQLESGDLIVESVHSTVNVATAVGVVSVDGIVRLGRDLAVEVGTYDGTATVAAGRTVTVPALEEDTIPSVGLVPVPVPLQLNANDPWDQEFLGLAIDLTSELDGQSRFVSANTPSSLANSPAFYRSTLPALGSTPTFTDALLTNAVPGVVAQPSAGDAMVAAAIALSGEGPFASRWSDAFELRHDGAQWGVVALDEGVNSSALLSLVGQAVELAELGPPSAPSPAPVTDVVQHTSVPTVLGTSPVRNPASAAVSGPVATASTTTKPKVGGAARSATPSPSTATGTATSTKTVVPPLTTTTTVPSGGDVLAPILDPVVNLIHGLLPGTAR